MRDRWKEALTGEYENHCMPFLWVHGGDAERIRILLRELHSSGVQAACLESRPHPDFLGQGWWDDVGAALAEARRLGMQLWILDDQAFPSGHAAGRLPGAEAGLRRWSLVHDCIDVPGPQHGVHFAVGLLVNQLAPPAAAQQEVSEKKLLGVVACRTDGSRQARLTGEFYNVTSLVDENGMLFWDVPEGAWKIVVISLMTNACAACNDYVNFLSRDSVRFLIDTVYEPHYAHFGQEFGRTLAGFFSDEPGFYTGTKEMYPLNEQIGCRNLPLPWSEELGIHLNKRCENALEHLPLLWYDGEGCREFRSFYMDIATSLYQKNYVQQVGDWCESHGVQYIGHVLEDNNSHGRLGCGPGHYFRAMRGQHMAGIDVVFNQILPGRDFEENCHRVMDGEFCHYALGKLASSSARLEPRMQGNAMAEIFGAGGWAEDISWMKWVADSLLVRGVNFFVPHAYTTKDFPDPDCPPHLFAMGKNPQHPGMEKLYRHINRCAHLLTGGKSVVHTAILYHAAAEWCGEAMLVQTPAKICMQQQVDFDFLSEDLLQEGQVDGNCLLVRENRYRLLILPAFDFLPSSLLRQLKRLQAQGAPLICLEKAPRPAREGESLWEEAPTAPLQQLPELLQKYRCSSISLSQPEPRLRCLHYRHTNRELFFLFNEEIGRSIEVDAVLPAKSPLYCYDPMENRLTKPPQKQTNDGRICRVELEPYESLFLISGEPPQAPEPERRQPCNVCQPQGKWTVSLLGSNLSVTLPRLKDLSASELFPRYSGVLEYRCVFHVPNVLPDSYMAELCLGEVSGLVQVLWNDVPVGKRIARPYRFLLDGLVRPGENQAVIQVSTTLFNRLHDGFSLRLPLPPTGLLGPVQLELC